MRQDWPSQVRTSAITSWAATGAAQRARKPTSTAVKRTSEVRVFVIVRGS
jgi:hypothetical protein